MLAPHSITINGAGGAGGRDDECIYAAGNTYASVSIAFRLTAPRIIEVSGWATNSNDDNNFDGASVSALGAVHPIFPIDETREDYPPWWFTDKYWEAVPDPNGVGASVQNHYYYVDEDYRPPWPAGDYIVEARIDLHGLGQYGDRADVSVTLTEVVPESDSFLLAITAAIILACAAWSARSRKRRRSRSISV